MELRQRLLAKKEEILIILSLEEMLLKDRIDLISKHIEIIG